MKTKLYLEIEGALDVRTFTNKKQAKPTARVILLDRKEVDKILNVQEKWIAQQLVLDELWKSAGFVEE